MAAYTKTTWTTGDLITAALLNKLETQYDCVVATPIPVHAASTGTHGIAAAIVGTTETQTLTNKTLVGFGCTAKGNFNASASGRLVLPVGADKYAVT